MKQKILALTLALAVGITGLSVSVQAQELPDDVSKKQEGYQIEEDTETELEEEITSNRETIQEENPEQQHDTEALPAEQLVNGVKTYVTEDGRFRFRRVRRFVDGESRLCAVIEKYLVEEPVVNIPQTIKDPLEEGELPVGYLETNRNFDYEGLKQVNLPEGLIGIGEFTFAKSQITSIGLPSTLQYIEQYAFHKSKLTSISLPESVKRIEGCAFWGCGFSGTVYLGKNLERIGAGAFTDTGVTGFEVSLENKHGFYAEDGILYQKNAENGGKRCLVRYPEKQNRTFVIPKDTEHILEDTFQKTTLDTLVIPEKARLDGYACYQPETPVTIILKHTDIKDEDGNEYFQKSCFWKLGENSKVIVKNQKVQQEILAKCEDVVCEVKQIPSNGFQINNIKNSTLDLDLAYQQEYTLDWTQLPEVTTDIVEWSSSNPSVAKVDKKTGTITAAAKGEAVITGSDDSGHKASIAVTCYNSKNMVSIAGLKITSIPSQNYTGKALKPRIIVKEGTKTLKNGRDYTVAYQNNKNPGKAKAIITGKGKFYNGSITKTFTIKAEAKKVSGLKYAGGTTSSISLKWKKADSANGYIIYRSTSKSGKKKRIKTITSGKTASYKNTKLTSGKTYYYWIKTYRKVGGKTYYSSYAGIATATDPGSPKVTVKAGKKKAGLIWKKVSGASGYEVYRKTGKKGSYKKIKTITKGTTVKYTNGKLKSRQQYYYRVRAYRTVGSKKIYGTYSMTRGIKAK